MKRSFLLTFVLIFSHFSFSQTLDPDFSFGLWDTQNIGLTCMAQQEDGKIILGSRDPYFMNNNRYDRLIRLNKDYTVDASFFTPFTTYILNDIEIKDDGKILISGFFEYKGITHYIIRLHPDGSVDETFSSAGINSIVSTLKILSNKKILIMGVFTSYNGTPAKHIALLNEDGSHDTSFSGELMLDVYRPDIMEQSDGKIIITGIFNEYNTENVSGIVRIKQDGSIDNTLNLDISFENYYLYCGIILEDDKIIFGGKNISTIDHDENGNIVKTDKDGIYDNSFTISNFSDNSTAHSIIRQKDGKFLVGHSNGIVRYHPDGTIDNDFDFSSESAIYEIAEVENGIIAFETKKLHILDKNGNEIKDLKMYSRASVGNIYPHENGQIIFGGSFNMLDEQSCKSILVSDPQGNINSSFNFYSDQYVQDFYPYTNNTYFIADHGTEPNSNLTNDFAIMNPDGTHNLSFIFPTSTINHIGITLLDNGEIIFGGSVQYSNYYVPIIKLKPDCSIDSSFIIDQIEYPIYRLFNLRNNKILMIYNNYHDGNFYLARLNPDGSLDTSFKEVLIDSYSNQALKLEEINDGKIYIAGSLLKYDGEPVQKLIRINADGTLDKSFSIDEISDWNVYAMALQNDGKIIVGGYIESNSQNNIGCAIRFNSDGSVDNTFTMPYFKYPGIITSISIINGDIYMGGSFIRSFSPLSSGIIKLSSGIHIPEIFDAEAPEPERIELSWSDNSTTETGYIIERSDAEDGIYTVLDTTDADVTTYTDTDVTPETTYFYRIKVTGDVGTTQYLSVSATTPKYITGLSDLKQNGIAIYPNPSSENVEIKIDNTYTGQIDVSITNILGETVYRKKLFKTNGTLQSALNVDHLVSGMYVVSIDYQTSSFTSRLMIQH